MIWLTWRQHRSEALLTLGVLAVGAVYLLITGRAMGHTQQESHPAGEWAGRLPGTAP
jgi:hypothetical protein